MRKYHIQNREDYTKYNRLCGHIKHLAARIRDLEGKSATRIASSTSLLQKLYNMGRCEKMGERGGNTTGGREGGERKVG